MHCTERESEREMEREALVGCCEKNMGAGITIWDIGTGEEILHIPTCASSSHGLLSLNNQALVASQAHKHGSLGGGAIFIWPLNKPQVPIRSYPIEAIGPICCTRDGIYLAGGSPSGNAYIWEVSNGRLLKSWRAHHNKSLSCVIFSSDDSLFIAGSDDGTICCWSMVSLLDVIDTRILPPIFQASWDHSSTITGLLSPSSSAASSLISSSLDGTCKVWDPVTGKLLRTQVYPLAITTIVLDLGEQLLFAGSADGRIFADMLDLGLKEDPFVVAEDQSASRVLNGHNGAITALAFSTSGLISASEDCTACIWDVVEWVITRRVNHPKGKITNLVVIPHSSMLSARNHHRMSRHCYASCLEKYPELDESSMGMITLPPSHCPLNDDSAAFSQSTLSIHHQITELEAGRTPAAVQMKLETGIENRLWATRMAKHVMEMNKHLQSRLLDMMQCRLLLSKDAESSTARQTKKLKFESSPSLCEEKSLLLESCNNNQSR